jgi:putative FmdB family regulatory protein
MPTYEYACPSGHEFELFKKMSDKPRAKCPACGKLAVRKISGGAGLHFKGSGFYITDYGKDGKGPRNDKARESSETSKPGSTSESTKPGTDSATKPAAAAEKPAPKAEKAPAKKAKASE